MFRYEPILQFRIEATGQSCFHQFGPVVSDCVKALGFLLGIPVAIITWYATILIVAGIMTAMGLHPDSYGVAPLAVIIVGPGLAILAWRVTISKTVAHFERLEREQAQRREDEERHRREVEYQRQAKINRKAEQRALALRLSTLLEETGKSANSLRDLVRSAESSLDLAGYEFADGAFAPFWDAIEESANALAQFDLTTQQLVRNSIQYKSEGSKLDTTPPPFQIGVQVLPDASHTANRMRNIVRRAQKDFHFATIYEQRKTNQLLVRGFSSLGQAINELGSRLDSSLDALSSSIGIAIAAASVEASSQTETLRQKLADEAEDRHDHERQVREMLDNIQRHREP